MALFDAELRALYDLKVYKVYARVVAISEKLFRSLFNAIPI